MNLFFNIFSCLRTKMFEQNPPHFFYGERMSLTGVPGSDDEFRFHPVEMGAGVSNDTIIAHCGIAIP